MKSCEQGRVYKTTTIKVSKSGRDWQTGGRTRPGAESEIHMHATTSKAARECCDLCEWLFVRGRGSGGPQQGPTFGPFLACGLHANDGDYLASSCLLIEI